MRKLRTVKKGIRGILKKLRKAEKKEEIPEGFVRCTRCGRIVKKEKATISLPEGIWVCDECYFRNSE